MTVAELINVPAVRQKLHKVDSVENMDQKREEVTSTVATHVDEGTKERYVLWSDVQKALPSVDYVEDRPDRDYFKRMFFIVDENYQLYAYCANTPSSAENEVTF